MSILRQLRYVHMYVGPCRYLLHEFMRCALAFGLNKFCQVSCSTHTSSCVHVFIEVSQLCPWWLAWCLFVFSMVQVFTMFGRVTCSPRRCLTSLMICDSSHEMVEQNGHRIINGRTSVLGNVCVVWILCLSISQHKTNIAMNKQQKQYKVANKHHQWCTSFNCLVKNQPFKMDLLYKNHLWWTYMRKFEHDKRYFANENKRDIEMNIIEIKILKRWRKRAIGTRW